MESQNPETLIKNISNNNEIERFFQPKFFDVLKLARMLISQPYTFIETIALL